MAIQTYEGQTMAEALSRVKSELGRDAVIVATRSRRKGRWLGLFGGQTVWQVRACANGEADDPPAKAGRYVPMDRPEAPPRLAKPAAPPPKPAAETVPPHRPGAGGREMDELRSMVQSLLDLHAGAGCEDLPAGLRRLRDGMEAEDVEPDLAREILAEIRAAAPPEDLEDVSRLGGLLVEALADRIGVAGQADPPAEAGHAPRVLAFIGPTGVGKTTTIAKLAADCRVRRGLKVGLITIDTYRIAAVDQLRTYAEIIDVPLCVVVTPAELSDALAAMRDLDVVLVDTAGRSQRDDVRLGELSSFLAAARPAETHLVVSATGGRACVAHVVERFAPLGVNRIVLSKVDEAESFGVIINVASAASAPLSYVTMGQDVPDDFAPADARRLAGWVAEGICGEAL